MVLAMDFVSYDGLSIVSQDTINHSIYNIAQPYGSCDGFRKLRWVIHRKTRYDYSWRFEKSTPGLCDRIRLNEDSTPKVSE